jgi:hypothetical protein
MNIEQSANARWDELPIEHFCSIFSEVGKPTPDTAPSLEAMREMTGTIVIPTGGIFSIAIPQSLHNLANIALVCSIPPSVKNFEFGARQNAGDRRWPTPIF